MLGTSPEMAGRVGRPLKRKRGRSPDPETTRVWLNQSSGDFVPREFRLASAASVDADGLQLVAPCVRNRRFPAVGQHDRRAVGGMQGKKLEARRDLRGLGEEPRHILGTNLLHIGDMAFTKMGQRLQ